MKLMLNTESLAPPLTGIGNYTLNLLQAYAEMDEIESILCVNGQGFSNAAQTLARCQLESQQPHEHLSSAPLPPRSHLRTFLRRVPLAHQVREALRRTRMRLHTGSLRSYVYHEPNFILKAHSGPSVATIHDLSFIHYPQFHPANRVAWLGSELSKTLARADMLLTDSELIRQELIGDFGVAADRVRSIYLGASARYIPQTSEQTQATLDRYGLEHGRYLLFVSTLEPRKGIDTLLDAWSSLPEDLRLSCPLVLAGAPGWNNQAIQSRITDLMTSKGLRHLHFVPADDLPTLYAGATLFVYPSLYEGFGLPVLEAMSCGVPVICTADTSMSEFTAGSAQLFERNNSEELAFQIQSLLEDDSRRHTLAQDGLLRSQDFSWQRCAEETFDSYRLVSR